MIKDELMNEMIQLRGLSIGYAEKGKEWKYIARGLQASLCEGKFTCLLGANGVGTSTLLRTLSGFLPPLEGGIFLQGKSLCEYSEKARARLIGVVLTERPDLHHVSVKDLACMGRSPYTGFWGRLSESDEVVVDDALRMVGMEKMATRMVDTLSDGERQKVMIAKALAQQTPVIFLDEPTAFLDYPSKVETMLLLRRLAHETGKTIFLSTHDVELALQTADTLWLMKRERGEERGMKGEERRVKDEERGVKSEGAETLSTCQLANLPTGNCLTIGSPRELADSGDLGRFFTGKDFTFDKDGMCFRVNRDILCE